MMPEFRQSLNRYWKPLALFALVLLSACATLPGGSTQQPTAGFVPVQRDQPTQPAPAWVEGAEEITVENAPRIAYIGQLTPASGMSTVFAHSFSPDGTQLAALNNDQLIAWDLIDGSIIFNTARDDALEVFYSPDKSEIYTLELVGQVNIYNAETGQYKDTLEAHLQHNGVSAYDLDAGLLTLGGLDGDVKVWDLAERRSLVTFNTGGGNVTALAFSPDGEWLATSSENGATQVWDWRNRVSLVEFPATAERLQFSPDASLLAAGEADKISMWNIANGSLAYNLTTGPGATTDVFAFSPDGSYLINGGSTPSIAVWDTTNGRLVNALPDIGGDRTSAVFSEDGSLLATSLLGGTASLWDMSQVRQQTLTRADLDTGTRQILEADWSTDGHLLLLFDATGPIQVWGIPAEG
jgi:dipeptidyl aminopeptidase/acylaminoacyl peptidase